MAGETGATTDRLLNKLQYAAANKAATGTTLATGDLILTADVSADYKIVAATPGEIVAGFGVTGTAAEINVLQGVTAGTATASKAVVLDANKGIANFRHSAAVYTYNQGAAGTLNATGTLTAALMLGGIVTSTTAAAVTATLDTGTLLETALAAAVTGLQNSDSFDFSVVNTGPSAFTIATATGWTDGGNGFTAVAAGTSGTFRVRRTAANTYTIFKIS